MVGSSHDVDNEGVNCFPSHKKDVIDPKQNHCLIRAVCKERKISTIVSLLMTNDGVDSKQ